MKPSELHLTDPMAIRARDRREAEALWRHLAPPAFCSGVSEYGRAYRRKIATGILSTFYGTRLLDKTS